MTDTSTTAGDTIDWRSLAAAALAIHYPAYNDGDRTPLCPECNGAEGTHPCGCYSPEGVVEVVCGHCHTGGYHSYAIPYPCPTVRALGVGGTEAKP